MISALQKLDLVIFLAVVGDPSAPVVARVELERLPLLLREAANTESTLALVNSETSDSLILDAPDPDSGPGEILVSASGVFLRVIDELMVAKRGGVEFTGN